MLEKLLETIHVRGRKIDLFTFHFIVRFHGGFRNVCHRKLWGSVASELGYGGNEPQGQYPASKAADQFSESRRCSTQQKGQPNSAPGASSLEPDVPKAAPRSCREHDPTLLRELAELYARRLLFFEDHYVMRVFEDPKGASRAAPGSGWSIEHYQRSGSDGTRWVKRGEVRGGSGEFPSRAAAAFASVSLGTEAGKGAAKRTAALDVRRLARFASLAKEDLRREKQLSDNVVRFVDDNRLRLRCLDLVAMSIDKLGKAYSRMVDEKKAELNGETMRLWEENAQKIREEKKRERERQREHWSTEGVVCLS